jgi:alpha-L-fucosidase
MKIFRAFTACMLMTLVILSCVANAQTKARSEDKSFWQKPGLGIQYQIEQRPGWAWGRNFVKFNQAMTDSQGKLKFDGPLCQTGQWVELSKSVGVDYHVMETKWHDGICYFDTKLTDYKTPVDYTRQFSEQSRAAGIPFMFYYSTIFDHNPQFDRIQPYPYYTFSMMAFAPSNQYEEYMRGQLRELSEQYQPAGFWLDWYMPLGERTSQDSLKFLRENFPDMIVTFNNSNVFPETYKKLTYSSGEAHDLLGSKNRSPGLAGITSAMNSYCYRDANSYRARFDHPWEFVSPCGSDWQVTALREDHNELVRMVATTLACGGKDLIGVATNMNGEVIPEHVRQMKVVGEWYKPRKQLFRDAEPVRYKGDQAPGVSGYDAKKFGTIMSKLGDDKLIHLINFHGAKGPVALTLKGPDWQDAKKVFLEPGHTEIALKKSNGELTLSLAPEQVDPVDTILRVQKY